MLSKKKKKKKGYGKQLRIPHTHLLISIFAKAENYLNLLKKCWESGNKEAATQTYKKINKKSYESNSDEPKCLN